jgi:hypothetical protein
MEKGADRRRENLPVANEIALLIPDEKDRPGNRKVILIARSARDALNQVESLYQIPYTHPLYHIFYYVLLYPFGEPGRDFLINLLDPRGRRTKTRVTTQIYHRYLLYTRSNTFNIKHRDRRLFQQ